MDDQEIIKAVAKKVMGWHLEDTDTDYPWFATKDGFAQHYKKDWNPITDANHWMIVVGRMRGLGWELILESHSSKVDKIWWTIFWKKTPPLNTKREIEQIHELPGRAVCLAALKAVEGEK